MSIQQPNKPSLRFFIIDDDEDDRNLCLEAVKTLDVEVQCHFPVDCLEAMELMLQPGVTLPDLIFLDINMPRVDGWRCLANLKSNEILKHIPVIIHSTSAKDDDKEKASQMGALCFIPKFFDFKKLKTMMALIAGMLVNKSGDKICEAIHAL